MKRFALYSIFALVALASCERELEVRQLVTVDMSAAKAGSHAYIVNPDETRTDFDSYVGKFAWSEGDKIAIHLSDGTFYETEVNAETGLFTCSTTSSKQRDAYAVYPASARDASNYGFPTLNVVLPAEYDIHDNLASDYSPVPMIAVNRQAEDDLYFRHVGGLLRITCDRVPSGTQKIAVTLDRNIAGTFTVVNPMSETPTASSGGDSPTVTFQVAETGLSQRTDGIILNIPVPAGAFTSLAVDMFDADGKRIYSVDRDIDLDILRSRGKKLYFPPVEEKFDSMEMVVTAGSSTEWTFTVPFRSEATLPANLSINWGDGTVTHAPVGATVGEYASAFSHTYAAAGDYTVTLEAFGKVGDGPFIPNFRFFYESEPDLFLLSRLMLKTMPTPLLKMQGEAAEMFRGCIHLGTVSSSLFVKNTRLTSFNSLFFDAGLTQLPVGLFDCCTEAVDMGFMFWDCYNMSGTIPADFFANNPKSVTFRGLFWKCYNLTGSIPKELFANNPLVTDISAAFFMCHGLTGNIPAGLFDNNPEVVEFVSLFYECYNLSGSIPAGLFDSCTKVRNFNFAFHHCTGLTGSVPQGFFDHNTEALSFYATFQSCSGLTGNLPSGLFDNCTKAEVFCWVFNNCIGLSGEIPHGFFAHQPRAYDFNHSFGSCNKLRAVADIFTGTEYTAANRFDDSAAAVDFTNCFTGIWGGTAPNLWEYTYRNGVIPGHCFYNSGVSDLASIPDAWK